MCDKNENKEIKEWENLRMSFTLSLSDYVSVYVTFTRMLCVLISYGHIVSEMDGYRACRVECIEFLCMVNPPVARLSLADSLQEIVVSPVKVLPSVF